MTYTELEHFFESFLSRLRLQGVTCAITSGMACVHFGVAATTKDCDALCAPSDAVTFLDVLGETRLGGQGPGYRGNLSAPLDERWLRGGWTSHFHWKLPADEAYLDVFGIAPRAITPWEDETQGLYAGPATVADMKHTDRDKDWPYITALGANLLANGDSRGWLHVFDVDLIEKLVEKAPIPPELVSQRPVLGLALRHDERLKQAIRVEREAWMELDRARLKVYERAVRPYRSAVQAAKIDRDASLSEQHRLRVACAERALPQNPIRDYGVDRLTREAEAELRKLFAPDFLRWLPDPRESFKLLET